VEKQCGWQLCFMESFYLVSKVIPDQTPFAGAEHIGNHDADIPSVRMINAFCRRGSPKPAPGAA
jgi:hypothetical protein